MFRAIQFVLFVVVLTAMSAVAQATAIPLLENQTTGAVIFHDDFEGGTAGSLPVAKVGTWGAKLGNGTVAVTNLANAGFAAYEGDKFLRGAAPAAQFFGITGWGLDKSAMDDTIKLQLAFRVPSGREVTVVPSGGTSGNYGTELLFLGLWKDSTISGIPDNSVALIDGVTKVWTDTGLRHDPNAWNTLSITHVNGTTAWAISVNSGVPYNATGYAAGATTTWRNLVLRTDVSPVIGYFDAVPVPEPSSILLLASGLVGLLCYAWRKRKCAPR